MLRARGTRSRKPAVKETKPRKAGSFANPEEVKKRNTRRFMAESERLRKEGLAANKAANTRGVGGNLAAAGGAAAKRAVKEDRTKQFLAESERLRKEGLAANKAAANKRVKSTDGKSDRPSAASMRDSAAQRAALAKSEPKKESKPANKVKVTGRGGRNVGKGEDKKANVTREQLQKTGLTLRDYLNFMDKNNRRPTKADAAAAKSITEGFKKKKAVKKAGGGMMKSKMKPKGMMAGGKMNAKGKKKGGKGAGNVFARAKARMMAAEAPAKEKKKKKVIGSPASGARRRPGMMAGGMMKSKMSTKGGMRGGKKPPGMKAGGKFPDLTGDGKVTKKDILKGRGVPGFKAGGKPKGYAAGGMKSKMATKKKPTKQKVRGAGIARKGVRPAKMR